MPYIPHTDDDRRKMFEVLGLDSLEALFEEIPARLRCDGLALPPGMTEMEVTRLMRERAAQNRPLLCFAGAGAYDHHIPAAVWEIVTRGEYYTAYTPYQAEASQGILQATYEFQSMMTELLAMDVANASLYDGASALAEAVLMAVRVNRHSRSKTVLLPRTLSPVYRKVVETIVSPQRIRLVELPYHPGGGTIDQEALERFDDADITALVIPQPNFFGALEDVDTLTDWARARRIVTIAVVNPLAMALLKPPGQWGSEGVDIACGEGQPLGIPLSLGGPYLGILACRQSYLRQLPGRIVGATVDSEGRRGYVLTLQAREQHIRRSKATSNICTNQGLLALAAAIHLSLLGPEGLYRVACACHANLERLLDRLCQIPGVEKRFAGPFFHETVIGLPRPVGEVLAALAGQGILGGVSLAADYPELGDALLVCATETRTQADIDRYGEALETVLEKRC